MSRRWTGWVLTAAAIAAGPAPALSSNESPQTQRTIVAQADALPAAGGYTDCLEVVTPREFMVPHNGKVLVLDRPYPSSTANANLRFDSGMAGDADEQLRSAIARSTGNGSGEAAPWLLLPEGKLVPPGAVQPTAVRAACGIPRGLTLLAPDDAASSAETIMASWIARPVGSATAN